MQLKWLLLLIGITGAVQAESPFGVTATLQPHDGLTSIEVAITIPKNHHLYTDRLRFEIDDKPVDFQLPAPSIVPDKFSGESKAVFTRSFIAVRDLDLPPSSQLTLKMHLQGCDDSNCYFPETRTFQLGAGAIAAATPPKPLPAGPTEWRLLAQQFTIAARGSGYLNEKEFLAFLDQAAPDTAVAVTESHWGLLATMGLIVLGGLGLNLTPCILPLIPINLAIIGAGAQAGSRRRGFALGGAYAAGMAFAYGTLGVIVVLTGAKFGTLNSSPWFNLIMAGIFAVLSLSMFDILAIDFSRFQGRVSTGQSSGKFAAAITMGAVAALLAGACVAPVVISVLLQATSLYSRGIVLGLALPFVLGVGMGLPWPFAGAGLSFLPKPGKWMTRVKYAFGVMIAVMGLYYGSVAYGLMRPAPAEIAAADPTVEFVRVLQQAQAEGKPVFVDFRASWCKNCTAMEHTTFRSPAVQQRLGKFLQAKLQAEHPNDGPARELLDHFGALGLPTYLLLTPNPRAGLFSEATSREQGKHL